MKSLQRHKGTVIWKVINLIALLCFIVLLWFTTQQHQLQNCTAIEIQIEHNQFLNEADILKEIQQKADAHFEGKTIYAVDIHRIERILNKIPFVKRTDVYMDNAGKLKINITEKQPLVRVVNAENTGYYIDTDAEKFQTSTKYTARVPIVSGHIYDNKLANGELTSLIGKAIFKLAAFIAQEPLWNAMVEQIYIKPNQDFVLIPKVGDFEVEIGTIDNLDQKFKKLHNFYMKGLLTENDYETINLKYEKQIVCSLKPTS